MRQVGAYDEDQSVLGESVSETWVLIGKQLGRKRVVADGTVTEEKESLEAIHRTASLCHLIRVFAEDVDLHRVLSTIHRGESVDDGADFRTSGAKRWRSQE